MPSAKKIVKVIVSSRVDPEVRDVLDRLAEEHQWTTSKYIEVVLMKHTATHRKGRG